ncbi:MAG: valine--tRNA ligase [bacterium]|nr:valine--tRNA ligase [bacterium]
MEIPTRYDPAAVEERWYAAWEARGYFTARPGGGKPYVIVIPPPNITGILTMGHVLNNTLQDILVRWKRMQGFEALWLPGTDHAGIATQNVVEKELAGRGGSRRAFGRDAFLEEVWRWRERYGRTIIRQLKRLGCSCDWTRERFTMDEGLSRAVREVFVRLHEKGLVYRGTYIINWCPRCHTALSDEEVEHEEHDGRLWHIRYPFAGRDGHVTVATTRPETMLGDTAVAVHPADERYRGIVGAAVRLPVVGREIPVIADEFVDPKFGTGIVKVTPAHDPNDFLIGGRHGLPAVVVMDGSAVMNERAGEEFRGMDRFECREALVRRLEELGLVEKVGRHRHAVGHCYRCRTVIEPSLSPQWFVRMRPLAAPALEAVLGGRIAFFPPRWAKVYRNWMENIRDWCISRQLWWGHRIPVWYCRACASRPGAADGAGVIVARTPPGRCPSCGGTDLVQDEDVLDTWFSSWLWPFSTLGWPDDTGDLRAFYPTTCLVTGPDIIFFWVARMIMAGLEFMGEVPFRHVFFTGIIRDLQGRKMSKSLGNSPDPLDVIERYGADALRFTIARLSPVGQDVYYADESPELGRNFANKIWNAARFVLMHLGDEAPPEGPAAAAEDRFILSRLNGTVRAVTKALNAYRFNEAAEALYDFFWRDYCDWYIEMVKPALQAGGGEEADRSRAVLLRCLETFLRLLAPFMPHLAEEIWQRLPGREGESVTRRPWPRAEGKRIDAELEARMGRKFDVIRAARNLRREYNVPPRAEISVTVKPASRGEEEMLRDRPEVTARLMGAGEFRVDPAFTPGPSTAAAPTASGTIVCVDLAGVVDLAAERARLAGELERIDAEIAGVERELANDRFLEKAPAAVVERRRARRRDLAERRARVEATLGHLPRA